MALELEELRKQLEGGVGKNRVQRRKAFDTEKTPPPKRAAASPTTASTKPSASKSKTTSPATPPPQSDSDSEEEGLTEAAKQQRLRRLCERKPSGRLNVPVEVHEAWKCGGPPRDDLMKLLEDANFKKAGVFLAAGVFLTAGALYPKLRNRSYSLDISRHVRVDLAFCRFNKKVKCPHV